MMDANSPHRLNWLDQIRGLALLAMTSFHLGWDLVYFGFVDTNLLQQNWFTAYGHTIASCFLFLVGVGLCLNWQKADPWPGYWRRLAEIVIAAALVSLASWIFSAETFIYFGILHCIAISSLFALPFLYTPTPLVILAAAISLLSAVTLSTDLGNSPWLSWTGLGTSVPSTDDFRPILPWFGVVLIGIAAGRALPKLPANFWQKPRWIAAIGRHSLIFYLVHQPILLAFLWIIVTLFPLPPQPRNGFMRACVPACLKQDRDEQFCRRHCECFDKAIHNDPDLLEADPSNFTTQQQEKYTKVISTCTSLP